MGAISRLLGENRDVRLLLGAGLVSMTGDWILNVGVAYYVYDVTGSTLASAGMLLAVFLPSILLSSVAGVFVALALLDLPQRLPAWLHLLLLLGFGGALGWTAWRGFRGFALPGVAAAERRLETASGLKHRPLAALSDRPTGDDPQALALWRAHQARAAAQIRCSSGRRPTSRTKSRCGRRCFRSRIATGCSPRHRPT